MFVLPDAKRIRRSDLYTSSLASSSPAPSDPDVELETLLRSQLEARYGPLPIPPPGPDRRVSQKNPPGVLLDKDDQLEHAFEFRLFSTSKGAGHGITPELPKILLDGEEELLGEGSFLSEIKDPRQWTIGKAQGTRLQEFESVALSGDDVLDRRKQRAWGLEVPWRVKVIQVDCAISKYGDMGVVPDADKGTRSKKPNKKKRIVMRQKIKFLEHETERRKKEETEKEDAAREKRIRRNREKKVKRKLKEKAKKIGLDVPEVTIIPSIGNIKEASTS